MNYPQANNNCLPDTSLTRKEDRQTPETNQAQLRLENAPGRLHPAGMNEKSQGEKGVAMNIGEELSDGMLANVFGGASIKEIITYINTNMSAVPERSRETIINTLIKNGKAGAVKMASSLLKNDQESLQSLLAYMKR